MGALLELQGFVSSSKMTKDDAGTNTFQRSKFDSEENLSFHSCERSLAINAGQNVISHADFYGLLGSGNSSEM